jgi:hypothetical protein
MREESGRAIAAHGGAASVRARRRGANLGAHIHVRAPVLAALVGAAALASTACSHTARVPPSQLPLLVASQGKDVRVRDNEGQWVTIDRTKVDEITIETHDDLHLMLDRPADPRLGPSRAVAMPDDVAGEASRQGWSKLREMEGSSFGMELRGNTMVIRGDGVWATVRLEDVAYVELNEPNWAGTTMLVILPTIAAVVVFTSFYAACHDGCLARPN